MPTSEKLTSLWAWVFAPQTITFSSLDLWTKQKNMKKHQKTCTSSLKRMQVNVLENLFSPAEISAFAVRLPSASGTSSPMTCWILLPRWIDLNRFAWFIMTKRYQCGTKLLCRLSSSSGAAVVAAPQPFQTKKIFEDLEKNEIWNSISCLPKSSISNLVSSSRSFSFFSPPGAAPSSRGTARRGGRWPVPEAAHRCRRRRQQRLQRLRQLQRLGLRFTKKKCVNSWAQICRNLKKVMVESELKTICRRFRTCLNIHSTPISALIHSGPSPIKSFSQPVQPAIIPQGSLPEVSEKRHSKIVAKKKNEGKKLKSGA